MTFEEAYDYWPHEVSIETFAKCNAACVFCPYPTLERQGTKMPDELIDRILDELRGHPWPFIISPFKVNEPFLDKRLLPLCRKINETLPQAHLRLFTNGSALTEKHMREVAELERVVHLWVSLNDHRPEQYRATMGLDHGRTIANLDRLHVMIVRGEFPHDVVVSRVMTKNGPNAEDEEFRNYVKARWPRFSTWGIKRDSWLGDIDGDDRPVPESPCGRWWELNITAEGKAARCCMDATGAHAIGDLNQHTMFEIYNQPSERALRATTNRHEAIAVCAGCNYGG